MIKRNNLLIFIFLVISGDCYSDIKTCIQANRQIDPQASEICKQALLIPGISADDKSIIYVTQAAYLIAISKFNDADLLLDTAFNTNPKMLENGTFRYNWLRTKGVLFFTKQDFVKALPFFIGAKEVAEIMDGNKNKATSYNALGATYLELHDYKNALTWLNKSLEIYKSENDSRYIAIVFANIAEVYLTNSQYKKALEYFLNSVDILKKGIEHNKVDKENFERPLAKIYLSIAHLHISQNQYLKANNNLLNALDIYQKYKLTNEEVKVLSTLGKLYIQESKLDKAQQLLLQAQALENTLETQSNLELKQNITELYLLNKEWLKAEETASTGLSQAKNKKNILSEVFFLESLATIYEKTNKLEKSIAQHKILQLKKEQIYKNKYQKSQIKLLKEIETTKEQRQIFKLKKQQSLQKYKATKQRFAYFLIGVVLLSLIGYLLFLLNRKEKRRKEVLSDKESHNKQLNQLSIKKEKIEQLFHGMDCKILCFNTAGTIIYTSVNELFGNKENKKMRDMYPDVWTQLLPYLTESEKINKDLFLENCQVNNTQGNIWMHQMEYLDDVIVCLVLEKNDKNYQENSCIENIRKYTQFMQKLNSFYIQSKNFPIKNTKKLDQALTILNNLNSNREDKPEVTQAISQNSLKAQLVDLMITSIDTWQNSTGKSSLELAEECGFWLVSVEDGQLRTRTMDKYTDIKKIPKNPRWRQVVKTAHFILSNCHLNTKDRQHMNTKVNSVKEFIRNRAISH